MKDGGQSKRAHDGPRPPEKRTSGTSPKDDKIVSPKLVPAGVPKLLNRSGHPRSIKEGRPRGCRLAKNDSPDQHGDVIRGVQRRAIPHAGNDAAECGQSGARDDGEARVEDAATSRVVYGGDNTLKDVMQNVQNRQQEDRVEQSKGDRRRWGALVGKRVGGPRPSDSAHVSHEIEGVEKDSSDRHITPFG